MPQWRYFTCCLFLLFTHSTNGLIEEVCIPLRQGLAGLPGPAGAPGRDGQCACDTNELSELRKQLRSQQEQIEILTQKINVQEPIVNFEKNGTNQTSVSIHYGRVKEIVESVIQKQNNCPVGLSDGRISDLEITASSTYNDSNNYAPYLARLNNMPKDKNIGAWKSKSVSPIRQISCGMSARSYRSNYGPVQNFSVECPSCQGYGYGVYGSKIFMDQSSICRAAVHDGRITAEEGGVVFVRAIPIRTYTASTKHRVSSTSYAARSTSFEFLPGTGLEWIQVDLRYPRLLTGVVTQGRPTTRQEWVTTYKVSYGNSTDDLQMMTFSNMTEVIFSGNTDMYTPKTNMFVEFIRARFVRLIPLTWNNAISLRIEYLTC